MQNYQKLVFLGRKPGKAWKGTAVAQKIQSFTQRQHMIKPTYEIYHYRDAYLDEVSLHHHDFYEMYLFLSGNVDYIIESRQYRVTPGDVLLISPNELHQPLLTSDQTPYERIVLWIDKTYLEQFSSVGTDLHRCFSRAAQYHTNLVRTDAKELQLLMNLLEHTRSEQASSEFGSALAADTLLIQALVVLNRLAERGGPSAELRDKSGSVVGQVLSFIDEHYHEDLSLDFLANRFFISKYHLSREFNRLTGTSVYRYIIQRRLVMAKQMLSQGIPSSEVYQSCGFGDYSNFYRAFKSEYQISPKEYVAKLKADSALTAARIRERAHLMPPQGPAEG